MHFYIDAGIPCAFLVAAQRVDVSAELCLASEERKNQGDGNRDDCNNGKDIKYFIGNKLGEFLGKAEHGAGIGDDQRDAAEDGLRAQGDNEGMQPRAVDQNTVDATEQRAQKNPEQHSKQRIDSGDHELCGNHTGQGDDRADG